MTHIRFRLAIASAMCALFLIVGAIPASAQKKVLFTPKDLPAAVTAAFAKAYPNAKIIGAGKEFEKGKTVYEVESMDGKTRRDLLYAPDGTVVECEETIAADALPQAVTAALTAKFKKYEVEKAETITHGTATGYEMVIEAGKKMYEVSTDPQGKILNSKQLKAKKEMKEKKEKKESEEEDDD